MQKIKHGFKYGKVNLYADKKEKGLSYFKRLVMKKYNMKKGTLYFVKHIGDKVYFTKTIIRNH